MSFEPSLSDPTFAIEIRGLEKVYDDGGRPHQALKGVDLAIPRGSLYGLLGPNGAGKSTLISILSGVTLKTAGAVSVLGFDVEEKARRARSSLGVVPQEINIDAFFSPREILEHQAGFYGVPKKERITDELLDIMELADKADQPCRGLSGGMRRRLMLAKAMAHRPPVLVLDEPTAGVDVELRRTLWDLVRRLKDGGTTILLTTHYLEEAEALCDHVAILHEGAIVANDSTENLLARFDHKQVTLTLDRDWRDVPENLRGQGWKLLTPRTLRLRYKPQEMAIGQILLHVQASGIVIVDLDMDVPDLEDVFMKLTKKG